MSGEGSEEKKQPLYKSESFKSAVVGGAVTGGVMKLFDWGVKEIRKKLGEYRQGRAEYERKEAEKHAEIYATVSANKMKEVLDKYLDKYFQDKDKPRPQAD